MLSNIIKGLLPQSLLPGASIKLGVTQGNHRPYARVSSRLGIFSAGKSLDLTNPVHLAAGAAVALLVANKVAPKKAKKGKAKPAEASQVLLEAPVKAESFAKF